MAENGKHNRKAIVRVSSRGLLLDWLNLQSPELLRRHPEVLTELRKYPKERDDRLERYIADVRGELKLAWESKHMRDRAFHLFEAGRIYRVAELVPEHGTTVEEPGMHLPPPDRNEPFHKAIFDLYATRSLRRLSKCILIDCPAPYFIRRKPRKQPYCTTTCHADGYAENKRNSARRKRVELRARTPKTALGD